MIQEISKIKKQFQDEWVLVEVVEEDELNRPTKGEIIAHSKKRNEIYERMRQLPEGFRVATLYTGETPPKGMVFAF